MAKKKPFASSNRILEITREMVDVEQKYIQLRKDLAVELGEDLNGLSDLTLEDIVMQSADPKRPSPKLSKTAQSRKSASKKTKAKPKTKPRKLTGRSKATKAKDEERADELLDYIKKHPDVTKGDIKADVTSYDKGIDRSIKILKRRGAIKAATCEREGSDGRSLTTQGWAAA